MRASRTYGSVRGDRGNPVPYRDDHGQGDMTGRVCYTGWGLADGMDAAFGWDGD
jgi:hypothetical protein